jgi:hypothetical protein
MSSKWRELRYIVSATGAGLQSRILLTPLAPGAPCASGGTKIDVGVDTNENGMLDASEIQQTVTLCGGSGSTSGGGVGDAGNVPSATTYAAAHPPLPTSFRTVAPLCRP